MQSYGRLHAGMQPLTCSSGEIAHPMGAAALPAGGGGVAPRTGVIFRGVYMACVCAVCVCLCVCLCVCVCCLEPIYIPPLLHTPECGKGRTCRDSGLVGRQ
jgi:hypothetical protein